jgi:hypothetical protein
MEYLNIVAQHIVPIIAVFLASFLSLLASQALKALKQRFNIEEDLGIEKRAMGLIRSGVAYAEEWALNKTKVGGDLPGGAEKLNTALSFIKTEATRMGLDHWVEARGEDLAKLIEAQVRKVTSKNISAVSGINAAEDTEEA